MAQTDSQGKSDASQIELQTETNAFDSVGDGASPVDSQYEAQATMQATFDNVVSREIGTPFRYTNVAVLIIRWEDYLDRHLKCRGEVQDLSNLFVKKFNFKSEVLVLNDKKNPQLQLDRGLANFVWENDGSCRTNLLIVYYTGHGTHSEEEGLDITGVRETGLTAIPPHFEPTANWNQAERSLLLAEADVLTILDTCSAGSVIKGINDDFKVFEVLTATARKSVTAAPGPRSFTKALIDSLNAQLEASEGAAFNTYELNEAIMRRRKNQSSHLHPRFGRLNGRFIKLAPIDVTPAEDENKRKGLTGFGDCSHLTLRFIFGVPAALSQGQTETLATRLSRAALDSDVNVRSIEWVNYRPRNGFAEWAALYRTVKKVQRHWKALILQKKQQTAKRPREESDLEDESSTERPVKALKSACREAEESLDMLSPPPSV